MLRQYFFKKEKINIQIQNKKDKKSIKKYYKYCCFIQISEQIHVEDEVSHINLTADMFSASVYHHVVNIDCTLWWYLQKVYHNQTISVHVASICHTVTQEKEVKRETHVMNPVVVFVTEKEMGCQQ